MESLNTLVNNANQVVRIFLNTDKSKKLHVEYKPKPIQFETKPAAYKSINSSSINILRK